MNVDVSGCSPHHAVACFPDTELKSGGFKHAEEDSLRIDVFDCQQNIDNRLRCQSGNGSRANVLDRQHTIINRRLDG